MLMTDNATVSTAAPAVLVTGASSGIGRETALRFAARGARLALASRSEQALENTARACRAAGAPDVLVHPTDIGDQEQVDLLVKSALARFGRLDVVVQSAAVAAFGRFEEIPSEVFDATVRTNLSGSANVARAALTHFRARGSGHLVLVGSLLGQVAVPYESPYVISKFAVNGLVRLLRQENRDLPGVKVHGVYPGPVDTPIYGNAANYYGRKAQVPPPVDDPATLAAAIVRATDRRHPTERSVGWLNWPIVAAYRLLPAVFDALVEPAMRAVVFTRQRLEPTAGNVLEPPPARSTGTFVDGRSRPGR